MPRSVVCRSGREDRHAGGAGRAVELRVPDLRVAGHLAVARLPAQLEHDLVHLAQPRGADRLAVGDEPAVGVDGQAAADLERAVGDQRLLLAVGAEAVLGEVDDLGARVGVLELDDVDVLGADARHLVRGTGRVDGRARRSPRSAATGCAPRTRRAGGSAPSSRRR